MLVSYPRLKSLASALAINVKDHDLKPLYHQFDAEAGPEFHWEYRKRDSGEFRVLIGKAESPGDDPTASTDPTLLF